MTIFICCACGTSFPKAAQPPPRCPICVDERQFVPRGGQAWTTPAALEATHANTWRLLEPGLLEIHTTPDFAIGQRAMLIRTEAGNFLWDCIALIDDATAELVHGLGGLAVIAISHPHFYTRCQDWANRFGCPVHLHEADREWVMRPDPAMRFWGGETMPLAPGLTLMRLGGHFPGSSVLHWTPDGTAEGVLLTGDTLQVVPRADRVSFMWSYPNLIPLPSETVGRIARTLASRRIDRIHGIMVGHSILAGGNAAIAHSARRYVAVMSGD